MKPEEQFVAIFPPKEGERFRAVLDSYGISWRKREANPPVYKINPQELLGALLKMEEELEKIAERLQDQEELDKEKEELEKIDKELNRIREINQALKPD